MLVDLALAGRRALVVGRGREPELKVPKLLDSGARVTVVGEAFTERLRGIAKRSRGRVELIRARPSTAVVSRLIEEKWPSVVFVSTGSGVLDEELAREVKEASGGASLVCVVDEPRLNDFNMPAIAKVGDIRVGVSTGGRSPAMAARLRDKVEKAISREDVLQVKLHGLMRRAAREKLPGPASRKDFVYQMLSDPKISRLLRNGRYADARALAERMLESARVAPKGRKGRGRVG